MLSPGGESDRFLIAKETKLVGQRSEKFVFCYDINEGSFIISNSALHAPKGT